MYFPVLKNRQVETNIIIEMMKNTYLNENVIPFVEIITDKQLTKGGSRFFSKLNPILMKSEKKLIVDIPKLTPNKSVSDEVYKFLTQVTRDPEYAITYMLSLENKNSIIPTISLFPEQNPNDIIIFSEKLRKSFTSIAYRLKVESESKFFTNIINIITSSDFLFLDMGPIAPDNKFYLQIYKKLCDARDEKGFKLIILVDHKSDKSTNLSIIDGSPIDIKTSIRDKYNEFGFDGFSDYSGITSNLPSKGGVISPAGIYYSVKFNTFIGYRSTMDLSAFEDHIAPSIHASDYWKEFKPDHHKNCPGCSSIENIYNGIESGKSQGKWKGITVAHYIWAISDYLTTPGDY